MWGGIFIYIKKSFKIKLLVVISIMLILFNIVLYKFDKIVTPTVIAVSEAEMRAKAMEVINKCILEEYSKEFKYNEIIHIDKDEEGNIIMLRADTLKMNKVACDVAINAQKELRNLGDIGIKLPIGYIFKNNILSYMGIPIIVKMQPIGSVETNYNSDFESAGINQTRHKIYVIVKTKMRIILPMSSNDIEVKNEVPIAETVIVGKIPNTAVQLDFKDAGFKIDNDNK